MEAFPWEPINLDQLHSTMMEFVNAVSSSEIDESSTLSSSTMALLEVLCADDKHEDFASPLIEHEERLESYVVSARTTPETSIAILTKLFAKCFRYLNLINGRIDSTHTLKELCWLLLITSHVLTDSDEEETALIPQVLLKAFPNILHEIQHPVVILSRSLIDFARWTFEDMEYSNFSHQVMKAVICFLARWANTYLMPGYNVSHILCSFAGENNQGRVVLETMVHICIKVLTSYPDDMDLQALTCEKLLRGIVCRKHVCVHLIALDAWNLLAKVMSTEKSTSPFNACLQLQRTLAEALVWAAIGLTDQLASSQISH